MPPPSPVPALPLLLPLLLHDHRLLRPLLQLRVLPRSPRRSRWLLRPTSLTRPRGATRLYWRLRKAKGRERRSSEREKNEPIKAAQSRVTKSQITPSFRTHTFLPTLHRDAARYDRAAEMCEGQRKSEEEARFFSYETSMLRAKASEQEQASPTRKVIFCCSSASPSPPTLSAAANPQSRYAAALRRIERQLRKEQNKNVFSTFFLSSVSSTGELVFRFSSNNFFGFLLLSLSLSVSSLSLFLSLSRRSKVLLYFSNR